MKTIIIAEAGVNHNGSLELAKKLVIEASKAGVDFIKFQTFIAKNIVSKDAEQANYQKVNIGAETSQLEMLKKLELSLEDHKILIDLCKEKKLNFLSTAFDLNSIDLLNKLELPLWKIPSGEITNLPYLRKIGALNNKVILSTGMANLGEIESAITVLTNSGTDYNNISLLHCTTEYPAPYEEVNLKAMHTLGDAFKLNYGYSDHTEGIEISLAAVAMGATIIEKHFTLDKTLPGPDHKASLEPDELASLVKGIRRIEIAHGNGIKKPAISELKNIKAARKSIVAAKNITKGEVFTEKNLTTIRPGDGLSPMLWDKVLHRIAHKDYKKDEKIEL